MREFARIERILAKIERIWTTVPDWRLGQLIANADRALEVRLFFAEDTELEKRLDDMIADIERYNGELNTPTNPPSFNG